ncbi:hypothetical protein Pst134EA_032464 [Puccinia striiformis f. sp. tritici]|uniref:uncharacterized protein n=1 Tax=Puccinia striiformis f. sp. tritici TaxID=168172 RepID=UPI0020080873|nr:uncharacterized protein Pst134EA_032464 [Puccinia striiformis f. sp. tritici]KAH9444237.1 hypothetical protein Pst134EA_032464 [Puccinia striiformis f. sp. tritici]KAH9466952.1 hypothetical protein Pst134EB_001992 [Puccinia striiformis f. sp. tritici]
MEDSKSEVCSNSQINLVLAKLRKLSEKCSSGPITCHERKDPTIDRMETKTRVFTRLKSIHLPSLKDHVNSLLIALDLKTSERNSSPDIELILEITSRLSDTLDEIISCIQAVAHGPPLPFETHDGGLKSMKRFRCRGLHVTIKNTIKLVLPALFTSCSNFITACMTSHAHLGYLNHSTRISKMREELLQNASYPSTMIDRAIAWSHKSDLGLVQEAWSLGIGPLDDALQSLTKIKNRSHALNIELSAMNLTNDQENPNNQQEKIAQVAQSAMAFTKLTRILLRKLSATTTTEGLHFALDPNINSETLTQLSKSIAPINEAVISIDMGLSSLPGGHLSHNIRIIRHSIEFCSIKLESFLVLLACNVVPLPPPSEGVDNHSTSSENQFEAYIFDWKNLLRIATNQCLDACASMPIDI